MNINPLREMKLFNFLYNVSMKEGITKDKAYELISNKIHELYTSDDLSISKRDYYKVMQSIHKYHPLDSEGKRFVILYYNEYYDKMG